jgi:Flp pilus assembly protein TadD
LEHKEDKQISSPGIQRKLQTGKFPEGSVGMSLKRWVLASLIGISVVGSLPGAVGRDLKITLPKGSQLTPVQKLNREGVEAIRKHNYEKAESLFYKAYLFDPDDPFTLNNLGYISELQGQVERAQRFYALAGQLRTEAVIDEASSKRVEGRSVNEALAVADVPLQLNHTNVEAVRLLAQGRAPEADMLLQEALKSDPNNIFTLNNMGVAKEMEGESQEALKYYDQAAGSGSDATAVVTVDRTWRGKPMSAIAAASAKHLRDRLQSQNTVEARVAEFNLRGVSAINRNDLRTADEDFRKAFALDPNNAFALNNIGYVAEIEGDRETAQFFYQNARKAYGADAKVALATRRSAEGLKLFQVAEDSGSKVETKVVEEHAARRRERQPILLRRRDNTVVDEPSPATQPSAQPNQPKQ